MNFLERLIAEWYGFQGYFVRTNIHYAKRQRGGYAGEMDVVAFHPKEKTLVHLEVSMDADSWDERQRKFKKKFEIAEKHYKSEFDFEFEEIKKVSVAGFAIPKTNIDLGQGVELVIIPEMLKIITKEMKKLDPLKSAVPEGYPLLRAIQFAVNWGIS
jgi:hypothetical protein